MNCEFVVEGVWADGLILNVELRRSHLGDYGAGLGMEYGED